VQISPNSKFSQSALLRQTRSEQEQSQAVT